MDRRSFLSLFSSLPFLSRLKSMRRCITVKAINIPHPLKTTKRAPIDFVWNEKTGYYDGYVTVDSSRFVLGEGISQRILMVRLSPGQCLRTLEYKYIATEDGVVVSENSLLERELMSDPGCILCEHGLCNRDHEELLSKKEQWMKLDEAVLKANRARLREYLM